MDGGRRPRVERRRGFRYNERVVERNSVDDARQRRRIPELLNLNPQVVEPIPNVNNGGARDQSVNRSFNRNRLGDWRNRSPRQWNDLKRRRPDEAIPSHLYRKRRIYQNVEDNERDSEAEQQQQHIPQLLTRNPQILVPTVDCGAAYDQNVNRNSGRRKRNGRDDDSMRGKADQSTLGNSKRRHFNLGFKMLEEMTEEDPDALVLKLLNENKAFSNLLDEKLSNDYIVLVIRVISKMCRSAFSANKVAIISVASKEKFIQQLKDFILNLPVHGPVDRERSSYYWQRATDFWCDMNIYCTTIINSIPSSAGDILESLVKAIELTLPHLTDHLSDDVKSNFKELQSKLTRRKEEMERKKTDVSKDPEPTDDFRNLSLYPTVEDIVSSEKAFLRKNVVKGPYDSVNHYLDVQFRLLREDFVSPLRKGVCDYLSRQDRHKKLQNIKIHRRVQFLRPELVNGTRGVLLQYDWTNGKVKIKYENSRKFMFGSLVCFTRNNFETLLIGKIIERKVELLQKGMLIVGFEPGMDVYEFNVDYVMVEYNVYFEPYYHVLGALKSITEENFPMKQYLIDVARRVEYPQYYEKCSKLMVDNHEVDVYKKNWPDSEKLRLNASQYEAFKNALTEKFAMIQGPPGTGKTYLGLLIAKTLIRNRDIWCKNGPMLIICYTNHALDQFLEGLIDTTDEIVRIGGQSKVEKLMWFNIKEARSRVQCSKYYKQILLLKRLEVQAKMRQLKSACVDVNTISNYDGVVDFSHFLPMCPELKGSWFETANSEVITNWLLGGRTPEERQREQGQLALEQVQRARPLIVYDNFDDESDGEEELFDGLTREENKVDIDDHFDVTAVPSVKYAVKVEDLVQKISDLKSSANSNIRNNAIPLQEQMKLKSLPHLESYLEYLTMRLRQGRTAEMAAKPEEADLRSPHNMHPNDRWRLYYHWLNLYKNALLEKLQVFELQCRGLHREYEESCRIVDTQIMKSHLVVGMTTTSAARLQTTLQSLKCPIVIVEEAAEILEAHVIASLTNYCQHLILIGDHQQLRPSTADYNIEKRYLLGISLFERMINNEVHCNLLNVQHRMRPEIAKLIVPAVYPKLENHPSVMDFRPVKGVDPCLYFVDHQIEEEIGGDDSKSNSHEAKFLLQLAKYLILNGYEPQDVTILVAYSGQMFTMWKEQKRIELLKDVRISVLDNYQGEESKIILLSLVRNNKEGNIGFLSIENRVCVALSRAREGFYMMGNINLLSSKSQIWSQVRKSLEAQDAIGSTLALRCQIHPSEVTQVQTATDFCKVSEGGCNEICGQIRVCGHVCVRLCHVRNREDEYNCDEKCTRSICDYNHPCPKLCYETCGDCQFLIPRLLACGHVQNVPCYQKPEEFQCQVVVTTELPCKHTAEKQCYRDADTFPCPCPCDTRIESCGHACRLSCHIRKDPDHIEYKCLKQCAKYKVGCTIKKVDLHLCRLLCSDECPPCTDLVKKKRTVCEHVHNVACNVNVDDLPCENPCKNTLPCGHPCKLECSKSCGNCAVLVDKVLPECNHKIKAKCSEEPARSMCTGKCPRLLQCGHPCKKTCKEECTELCVALIDNPFTAACGHKFKIPCHLKNKHLESNSSKLLRYCRERCKLQLECKHKCSGTCGECHQGRIHKSCAEVCGRILVCGHECSVPCRQMCQPCNLPCTYSCRHSKCKKKCGELCTPCKEACPRRCRHITCKAKCGDLCTVPPCNQPCRKKLKCGHPCVGFCNDPCPPLCLVCNKSELTEEFVLGYEEERGARFVLLEECGHVIESRGMEMWLQSGGDQISVKRCPRCNTTLSFTKRYSNYIKESIANVANVKRKYYGSDQENDQNRAVLLLKLQAVCEPSRLKDLSPEFTKVKLKIKNNLQLIRHNKRQKLHSILAKTFTSKIQIFEQICELFNKSRVTARSVNCVAYINFLLEILMRQQNRITNQEIEDFESELKRLRRLLQFSEIEERTNAATNTNPREKELYKTLLHKLYAPEKYNVEEDGKIKDRLTELARKTSSGLDVSDEELRQIVKAVGVKTGAWYKCPNGHPYAIGECGGAMQVSKCIECGAPIGGRSHQVLPNNAHAGNMDQSSSAAWSDAANMANYVFD